ncbi:MAG TPA: hypothetical protein VLH80_07525 [Nitrospiraceae bacterium]|nr:hypothetical protein [Nitrospiraceae bacterium]
MSEPDVFSVGSIMQWLTALITTLLGFIGVRLHNRLDKLQEEAVKLQEKAVTRTELKEIQDQNRADRAALHTENTARLERIETKIDVQVAVVQRLTHLEAELERLRDWKHELIDPYIPGEFNAIKAQLNRIEQRFESQPYNRRRTDT